MGIILWCGFFDLLCFDICIFCGLMWCFVCVFGNKKKIKKLAFVSPNYYEINQMDE